MKDFSPSCVVDVDLTDASVNDARRIATALVAVGAVPRLRSDAAALEAFLSELDEGVIRWIVGPLPTILRAAIQRRAPTFATVEIDGLSAPSVYRSALEHLFDHDVLAYVAPAAPHGLEAIAELQKCGAPTLGIAEDPPGDWPLPHGRGKVERGGRVDDRFVWELDQHTLRARFDATDFWLPRLPIPVSLGGPGNARVRRYYSGGSQHVGHSIETDAVRVSLGFSNEAFDPWFATLVGQSQEFHNPTFTMPVAGVLNEEGSLRLVRARREMRYAIVVASALMRGDRKLAEQVLGIATGELSYAYGVLALPVDDVPPMQLSAIVSSAQELMASACGCIAASALPEDIRRRAAIQLSYNPHPHAERVARWLGQRDRTLEFVLKKFRNKPAENVRRTGSTPSGGLANLRRQIAELVSFRGGSK